MLLDVMLKEIYPVFAMNPYMKNAFMVLNF